MFTNGDGNTIVTGVNPMVQPLYKRGDSDISPASFTVVDSDGLALGAMSIVVVGPPSVYFIRDVELSALSKYTISGTVAPVNTKVYISTSRDPENPLSSLRSSIIASTKSDSIGNFAIQDIQGIDDSVHVWICVEPQYAQTGYINCKSIVTYTEKLNENLIYGSFIVRPNIVTTCSTCSGGGILENKSCASCGGDGLLDDGSECSTCNGSGVIDYMVCNTCGGLGKIITAGTSRCTVSGSCPADVETVYISNVGPGSSEQNLYSYNDAKLPELLVWNKAVYPHGYIYQNGDKYTFIARDRQCVYNRVEGLSADENQNKLFASYNAGELVKYQVSTCTDNVWSKVETVVIRATETFYDYMDHIPIWSNYDIIDTNGDIYLSKSEPTWTMPDNINTNSLTSSVLSSVTPVNGTYSIAATFGDTYRFVVWGITGEDSETLTISNVVISANNVSCLSGDTLITMADNSKKRLDEIVIGDMVMSEHNKPVRVYKTSRGYFNPYHTLYHFEDGTIINETRDHRFYNTDQGFWQLLRLWNIGDHAINQNDEKVALVAIEKIDEEAEQFGLWTDVGSYYANGFLSGMAACNKPLLANATADQIVDMVMSTEERHLIQMLGIEGVLP